MTDRETTEYIINAQDLSESVRLTKQATMLREYVFGGLFPEYKNELPSDINTILDVACGPGSWAIELAGELRYRSGVKIFGFDVSKPSISYARDQAKSLNLEDITDFQVIDAISYPWIYPDQAFDLVNIQLISGFIRPNLWPDFLRECVRVLRPGGILRLTETENGMSNSYAAQRLAQLFSEGLCKLNQSFSVDGRDFGILTVLPQLLRNQGIVNIQKMLFAEDYSFNSPAYEETLANFKTASLLLEPFYLKTGKITTDRFPQLGITTSEDYQKLYHQMVQEMSDPGFCGLQFYITYWGTRP